MLKNKRADVSDIILVGLILFFFAISFVIGAFINDKFKTIIETTALNDTDVSEDIIEGLETITTKTIQRGYVLIFGFLAIGMITSSFLIRIHPIFLFIWIIFGSVGVLMSVVLSNAYGTFIASGVIAEIAAQQTMITWIMQHMVAIMIGLLALSMIIVFAKLPAKQQI